MAMIDRFIPVAERVGMPVKMLSLVAENYAIKRTKGTSYTEANSNTVFLNEDVHDELSKVSIGAVRDASGKLQLNYEANAVNELYHEMAHAFIDLRLGPKKPETAYGGWRNPAEGIEAELESPEITALMRQAEKYYAAAPYVEKPSSMFLDGPLSFVFDPEGAALEAISMYIGYRARFMWNTIDRVTYLHDLLDNQPSEVGKVLPRLLKIVTEYDEAMTKRDFGYDQRVDQHRISRPISNELKKACDKILENKIPENFHQSATLNRLHMSVLTKRLSIINKSVAPRKAGVFR